jgi:Putative DNA-binding domain
MPTLRELQGALRHALLTGEASTALPLLAGERQAAEERLGIYRNTLLATLTKGLGLAFPAVQRLVGEAFFEAAAHAFIGRAPPRAACIDLYGADFPAFLAGFPPAAGLDYLPDVARLEWAVNAVLHAPDVPGLDLARLGSLPADQLTAVHLQPSPSVLLLKLGHAADEIWRAVLTRDEAGLATLNADAGPVRLLVQRSLDGPHVRRLDAAVWHFTRALFDGLPLSAALQRAPDIDLSQVLAGHLASGVFTALELHCPTHPTPEEKP